jgi:hypothetical protein
MFEVSNNIKSGSWWHLTPLLSAGALRNEKLEGKESNDILQVRCKGKLRQDKTLNSASRK